ncbi:hypothetical protein [Actinosynnema sp.]|uniref:hypothetical protein n=1 Tax=Actinosynnema sp. TaxID=1872144 RepID=UPI003F871DB0
MAQRGACQTCYLLPEGPILRCLRAHDHDGHHRHHDLSWPDSSPSSSDVIDPNPTMDR